jgi:hypothetical protein
MKYLIITFTFLVIISSYSCNTSKNSIQIKLNDIDSAIRVVIPSHNCGCNWQEKKSYLYLTPVFKIYGFSWQAIFIKNIDSVNVLDDSKKVFQELVKLDSRYTSFKRFFLEYRIPIKNDTLNYKAIGTWYHFDGYCDGYVSGVTAVELEKNTAQPKDRIKLCK